jgi:hypothetical protein
MRLGACVALLICGWSLEAVAAISINPSPLDAGTAMLGQPTSASGTLSSTNNVHVDLDITSSCSGGGGTFSFDMTANINLNSPATVTVTYVPSARGTRTCRVDVFDTGTNNLLGSFNVRGTGQAPPTMTTSAAFAIPAFPDFGATRWNNAAPNHSTSRNVTVSNGGDQTLDVTIATSGTNAADYALSTTSLSVPAGGARTFSITFDPVAGGDNRQATLTISGNDPANPSDTFTLSGDGTNAVISVTTPLDFGIVNTGSSAPLDVPIANIGGATKGPLGVTSATITDPNNSGWFAFTGSCSGQSCTFSPALSFMNSTNVGIRCSPPATAAAGETQTATIRFTSDTDNAGASPANFAALSCEAGKSALATNANTVTFGSQLVASTTSPNMVTISNTGNVGTTYYLLKTGTNQGQFSLATPTGCGLTLTANQCPITAMGASTFTVTFTPGIEGDVSAGVTIIAANTSPVQVTLTGRGINRHIALDTTSVQFPDTFRNPGDMATIMPITIKNIGEYPLKITNVALDGAPNWALAEPFQPFEIAGLGSHDVNVLFTPVTAGKAPDGTLAIASDDPDASRMLLNVVVSGNGKDRNVAMPGPIDFGNTGAGVPVKLTAIKTPDQWLTVHNMDDTMFKIRAITFDMPDVFKVQTLDGDNVSNIDLPAGGMDQFEIVFAPPKVGDFTANMTLFLDQDPEGQRTIEVHGNALFVDAHGGGGCSTGHGAGGGLCILVLALVRRKRRLA